MFRIVTRHHLARCDHNERSVVIQAGTLAQFKRRQRVLKFKQFIRAQVNSSKPTAEYTTVESGVGRVPLQRFLFILKYF